MIGSYTLYISLPLVFISAVVLVLTYFTKKEDLAYKYFYFLCVTILIWNVFQAAFASSTNVHTAEFFFTMQMLAIPFMPVALLMYVLKFSGYDKILSCRNIILMCLLPVITVILNFTNDFHNLFRIYFAVVEISPIRVLINERGPWFWVHTAYSYAAMILAIIIIFHKIKGAAKASRLRYYMIILGSLLSIVANAFVLFIAPGSPIDGTLWGSTFGLLFLYFAMDTSPTSNYALARNQVFDAIGEYIFVLNEKGVITDINSPARSWLAKHGITSDPTTLNTLLSWLKTKGATIESDSKTGRWELFFTDEENSLFSSYAIKSNQIYNRKQAAVGTLVTFSNMTAIRETLRDLQALSTIDELTGTYNRRGYEKMLADCDEGNLLPLCIIMGDVNGLKQINDTFGHLFGDQVLRSAAQILVECAGEHAVVSRIGGDEFATIIPIFSEPTARNLLDNIKAAFAARADEMHGAGIALGYAIKHDPSQDLMKIIHEADQKMYLDKQNDRRRR